MITKDFKNNPVLAYDRLSEKYWEAKNTVNRIKKIMKSKLPEILKLDKIQEVLDE